MAAHGRGWLRSIAGLLVAAAVATVPLWWGTAGAPPPESPPAPAWPRLVAIVLGAAVAALALPVPRPSRRRRLERRIELFERSFVRRVATAGGELAVGGWRRELAGRRAAASERLAGPGGRRGRPARHADALLEERWQRIAEVLAQRERAAAGPPGRGVPVADLLDAALRDACGAPPPEAEAAVADRRSAAADAGSPRRASAPKPPAPPPSEAGELPGHGGASAPRAAGAPVTVYETHEFAKAVQQARASVALEGGVYRVREQLYGSGAAPRRSLRRVAEGVVTDAKIARLEGAGHRRQMRLPVTGDGLHYDQLVAQFPDPGSADTRGRVLEDQRVALAADAAVLLASRAAGYAAALTAGSPAAVLRTLVMTAGNALYDDYLRERRYLLAGPGAGVRSSLPFVAERVALLPAVLDGRRAYLLFAAAPGDAGAETGLPWSRETVIERLGLYP